MMGLISCQSNQTKDTELIYVYPELDFPNFPKPKNVIPLDDKGQRVTDDDTEIINILIPYWYWNLIIDYKLDVDDTENYYNAYKSKINK